MVKVRRSTESELFNFSHGGFLTEAECLAKTAAAPDFKRLLKIFGNYPEFLASSRHEYFSERFFDEIRTSKTLDFCTSSEDLRRLKQVINLAAACDLFNGWSLAVDALDAHQLRNQVKQAIKDIGKPRQQTSAILATKLNNGDATRVIHMLKILGWLAPNMENNPQLSLGASGGTRDRYAIHQMPALRYQQNNPLLSNPIQEMVSFATLQHAAGDIALVDNDAEMGERYRKLNEEPNLLALNLDVLAAMKELKSRIDRKELAPRKFVVAFRIDHRMIPETGKFFRCLGGVIDDTADLVITIGAGHTNQEFKGRMDKIGEIGKSLTDFGLNPVQIRWCCGDTLAEQRGNPVFGEPTYATYEILYCKLSRSALLAGEKQGDV